MSGLHIVKKALPGLDRYYVYAWRKGPRIHVQDHTYPVITPAILAKQAKEFDKRRQNGDGVLFNTIIDQYRASPEYEGLAHATKLDYRRWLDRISDKFGKTPLIAFEDRRLRGDIINWRNQWQDNPRTADKAAVMMSTLLNFAIEHGKLKINVAARIKQLHKVNKADQIWEPHHWEAIEQAEIPSHLMDALVLASLTGLRLSDLVALQWSQVFPTAIKFEKTKKRGGRAIIPLLPELKAWMKDRPREGHVLRNSRGYPWTASGLGSVFQKSKPEGFDRTIHDLRGTFATRLIMAGFTDEQAALVMAWTAKRVAAIRARYVDEERVILDLAAKLSRA